MGVFPVIVRAAGAALLVCSLGQAQDATEILKKVAETYTAFKN